MSEDDPKRLSELTQGDDAGAFLRDAIRESKRDLPDETRLAAIALKLGPALLGGAAGGGGGAAAAASGAGAAKASAAPAAMKVATMTASMKLFAAVAVTAVAVGGGAVVAPRILASHSAVNATPTATALVSASRPPLPTASSMNWSLPPASASAQAVPVPTTPPTATMIKPPNPDDEVRTLERAQDALNSNHPSDALSLCNDDAIIFPHGQLSQDREVLAINALMRLGRVPEAKARAKKFEHDFPGSAALPRVHHLIGATP